MDEVMCEGPTPLVGTEVPHGGPIKRNIMIEPLDYGYKVKVGCQVVAIEKVEKLIALLTQYLTNPEETEKKYYEKTLF